jgi:hypothetical protein
MGHYALYWGFTVLMLILCFPVGCILMLLALNRKKR